MCWLNVNSQYAGGWNINLLANIIKLDDWFELARKKLGCKCYYPWVELYIRRGRREINLLHLPPLPPFSIKQAINTWKCVCTEFTFAIYRQIIHRYTVKYDDIVTKLLVATWYRTSLKWPNCEYFHTDMFHSTVTLRGINSYERQERES